MIAIEIDKGSGFCFGVVNAIQSAESELRKDDTLYCLGDIVHNNQEMERLKQMGLLAIDHQAFAQLRDVKVLLRAHGEPPATYALAKKNRVAVVDATCPVVLRLQQKIRQCYTEVGGAQIVIYGQKGHAEVNGLVGQTEGTALVAEQTEDLDKIDFTRKVILFSQTTQPLDGFRKMVETIHQRMSPGATFNYFDTICRQVAHRLLEIKAFAARHDRIYFVAGKQSSNGKALFDECLKANPNSVFISHPDEIVAPLPPAIQRIGICGATSTPQWLMEAVAHRIDAIAK